jgi:hypothetical protein
MGMAILLAALLSPASVPAPATNLCALKQPVPRSARRPRHVSITALVHYDFEHGYFLSDPACRDRIDDTGQIRIDFPRGRQPDGLAELEKAASQDFLKANVGKRLYCQCVGTISYLGSYPIFTLERAERVWAADGAVASPGADEAALAALGLSPVMTRAEITAQRGAGIAYGPGGLVTAWLAPSGEPLWLSFDTAAPYRLARAVLSGAGPAGGSRILLDRMAVTRRRTLAQLDFSHAVSVERLAAAWGPPDGVVGSGIDTWLYDMADGRTVSIIISREKVVGHRVTP